MNNFKLLAIVAALAACSSLAADAQQAGVRSGMGELALSEGMLAIKQGRLDAAEAAFRRAIEMNPLDQSAHYYLANLLVKTKRHHEAQAEYKSAYRLDPESVIGQYCREALETYSGNADSSIDARTLIRRQAQSEKERKGKFGKNLAKNAINAGDWKARDIKDQAEHEIAQMYQQASNLGPRGRRNSASYAELQRRAEEIRRDAEQRAQLEMDIAKERSAMHDSWTQHHQANLDDTAQNLEDQFTTRQSQYSNVSLDPAGTGLFVRNYKSSNNGKKLPESRLGIVRIVQPE